MIAGIVNRTGRVFEILGSTCLVIVAVGLAALGTEIAYSNMQTSAYSVGSIVVGVIYLCVVIGVPVITTHGRLHGAAGWNAPSMRLASGVSILCECIFVPFAFLLFLM